MYICAYVTLSGQAYRTAYMYAAAHARQSTVCSNVHVSLVHACTLRQRCYPWLCYDQLYEYHTATVITRLAIIYRELGNEWYYTQGKYAFFVAISVKIMRVGVRKHEVWKQLPTACASHMSALTCFLLSSPPPPPPTLNIHS